MDKYERENYATNRKTERARSHDALIDSAPKRRKGTEVGEVIDMLVTAHNLLYIYDLAEQPPSIAGVCETTYEAAVARLAEIIDADK